MGFRNDELAASNPRSAGRFIIGTGRCGSTLLGKLLGMHPEALLLSEFIQGLDHINRFMPGNVTGERLAGILKQPSELDDLYVQRGFNIKENLFEGGGATARKSHKDLVPAILYAALPELSPDPLGLLDEMVGWALRQPPRPVSVHYQALFDWLMRRFGKSWWVERSGISIEYLPELRRCFPDARYVHIHRDGPEAVLSMREHAHFIMSVSYFTDPPGVAELEESARMAAPPERDAVRRRFQDPPSLDQFAAYWTSTLMRGVREFRALRPEQLLEIAFETLVEEPHETLREIAAFFELPPGGGWIERAVTTIARVPTRADGLPAGEKAALERACLAGQIVLGRAPEPPVWAVTRELRRIFRSLE